MTDFAPGAFHSGRVVTIEIMPIELSWPTILTELLAGSNLSISEASWAMEEIVAGRTTPSQLAGFLVALRAKGETVDEIVGFRDAVLANAQPLAVDPMALDIVGTGGDRFGTVNVSTMSSIVAAAAGAKVVKHGNKAASSASGSSDVLAALGLDLSMPPAPVASRGRDHLRVRGDVPPRISACGTDAGRARHPDRLQLSRPALQPGSP
jgi:anthranilate phosphoribosyltransferase